MLSLYMRTVWLAHSFLEEILSNALQPAGVERCCGKGLSQLNFFFKWNLYPLYLPVFPMILALSLKSNNFPRIHLGVDHSGSIFLGTQYDFSMYKFKSFPFLNYNFKYLFCTIFWFSLLGIHVLVGSSLYILCVFHFLVIKIFFKFLSHFLVINFFNFNFFLLHF